MAKSTVETVESMHTDLSHDLCTLGSSHEADVSSITPLIRAVYLVYLCIVHIPTNLLVYITNVVSENA